MSVRWTLVGTVYSLVVEEGGSWGHVSTESEDADADLLASHAGTIDLYSASQ